MKQPSLDDLDLVIVARAVKTRGLKGELVAELLTDFPDRFADISSLIAVSPEGNRKTVELESHWFQQGRVVLKFAGFDSIEAATELVGYDFAEPQPTDSYLRCPSAQATCSRTNGERSSTRASSAAFI